MDDVESTPLDADIESLLDAERAPGAAPAGARERVWDRVRETVSTPPAPTPSTPTAALSLKGVAGSLGVAVLVGALVIGGLPSEESRTPVPAPPPEAPVERFIDPPVEIAPTLLPVRAPVVVDPKGNAGSTERPQAAPAAEVTGSQGDARKRKASGASSGSDSEQALLDRGRRALREGRASLALQAVNEHKQKFRRGRLAEEREALRIRALSKVGDREASREAARAFMKRYPTSIHRLAVERVLGSE